MPDNIYTMVCELCKGGHREEKIIICDRCDRGCHLFCLQPPLENVPEGEWICPLCIAENSESRAFRAGKEYTMDQFEKLANDFKVDWFGNPTAAERVSSIFQHRKPYCSGLESINHSVALSYTCYT